MSVELATQSSRTNVLISVGSLLTMVLWATCYPLISLSLPYAPIMLTAFLRAAIAGVFLLVIASMLGRPFPKTRTVYFYILGIGITATSIGFWGMFYAGSLISPGLATVLTNTQPLIAGLLGSYLLKEYIGRRALIGTLVGFSGVIVISMESLLTMDAQSLSATAYVLLAATGIATSNILLKKSAHHFDVLFGMGLQLLIGSLPLALLTWIQAPAQAVQWNWSFGMILLALAIPGTALPFIMWFWLMDKAPLYKLNVYNFLTPAFGMYLGYAYFSETLTLTQWLGILLILLAIPLVNTANNMSSTIKR